MGFLDKVKEQAGTLANTVNDTVNKGQASMDQSQSRKHADGLLRDLGALVYARDTGRGGETTDADITRLMTDLQAHEAQGGVVDMSDHSRPPAPGAAPPPPGGAATPPPPGGAATPPPPGGATPPPPPGGAATPPPPGGAAAPPQPGATPPPAPGSVAPPPAPGTVAPPPPPGSVS
jgi:hypothetical protein